MNFLDAADRIRQTSPENYNFNYLTSNIPEGLILEFGVASGGTLRDLAETIKGRKVYGFDWFKGLPEDWGPNSIGSFSTQGNVPDFSGHPNIEIVNGLFQDTLPEFLNTHPEQVAFIHFDCDVYSAASFVFEHIERRFQPGTVLAFDEIIDFHGGLSEDDYGHWYNGEYKAFVEMLGRTGITWECIARQIGERAAIKILTVA